MHQESTAIDVTVAHPTAFTLPSRYQEWVACRYTGPFRILLEGRFHVGSSFQGGQKRLSCIRKKRRKLLLQAMGPILWCPWYISDASFHFPETIFRGTMPNQDTFHLQLRNHSLHLPLRNVQRSGVRAGTKQPTVAGSMNQKMGRDLKPGSRQHDQPTAIQFTIISSPSL